MSDPVPRRKVRANTAPPVPEPFMAARKASAELALRQPPPRLRWWQRLRRWLAALVGLPRNP